MKKWIAFLMSLALVFSLAACGQRSAGEEKETSQAPQTTAPVAETTPETTPETEPAPEGKTLVVYYSATGNTEMVADYIAVAANADRFELIPAEPYSDADLDWWDDSSRVVHEYEHPEDRAVELVETAVPDWDSYDTVFIGYPIWWGIAAWPVDSFVNANDFTGKTVIPFCTSSTSGLGDSGTLLAEAAGTGTWLEGERFSSGASEETVHDWVMSLGLE